MHCKSKRDNHNTIPHPIRGPSSAEDSGVVLGGHLSRVLTELEAACMRPAYLKGLPRLYLHGYLAGAKPLVPTPMMLRGQAISATQFQFPSVSGVNPPMMSVKPENSSSHNAIMHASMQCYPSIFFITCFHSVY
jgi:hypothetical protein